MIVLLDNYDSFTFNLVQFLGDLGATCEVVRNDAATPEEIFARNPEAVVISPGPGIPENTGICLDVIRGAPDDLPIFGVCLGHQCVAHAFGGDIVQAPDIMHGKLSPVHHDGTGVFAGLDTPLEATRYHSLTLAPESVPDCLQVAARTEDGTIMAVAHKTRPVYGVQFHPESIASESGHAVLKNFLKCGGVSLS